jgi:hypothetical protein
MKNLLGSNQFKTKKRKESMKNKKLLITIIGILVICFGIYAFKAINNWYSTHYFEFKAPVEMKFNQPVAVKIRVPKVEKIVLEYPDEIDTPIKKYICDKWGVYDCKTALAVAKAESGFREDAININTNNTIDVGIFQINSVHFKKAGCSIKDLVDQYKNVDCAYTIYKDQGFTPWVAFNNGNYLANL